MEKTAMCKLAGELREYVKVGQGNAFNVNQINTSDRVADMLRAATGTAGGFQLPARDSFQGTMAADPQQLYGTFPANVFSPSVALSRLLKAIQLPHLFGE